MLTTMKMVTEILIIFSTTVLIWLVLKNTDINNGSCDLSEIFDTDSIARPQPLLELDCKSMPALSEFVDYWANQPNLTDNMDSNALTSFLQTVDEDFCEPERRPTASIAAVITVSTFIVLINKYLIEYFESRFRDFPNSGALLEIPVYNLLQTFIFSVCIIEISITYILVLSQRDFITFRGDALIMDACKYGQDTKFEFICFWWFSVVFAGICGCIFLFMLGASTRVIMKIQQVAKHPRVRDSYEAYSKTSLLSRKPFRHEEDPFFTEFGDEIEFDECDLTVMIKCWE